MPLESCYELLVNNHNIFTPEPCGMFLLSALSLYIPSDTSPSRDTISIGIYVAEFSFLPTQRQQTLYRNGASLTIAAQVT